MQAVLGVIFHFIGGFASGSFYIPYKKVKGWAWESYWIVGGIFSWLLAPLVAAYLTVPDFMGIIANASSETVFWTYLMAHLSAINPGTLGQVQYLIELRSSAFDDRARYLCTLVAQLRLELFRASRHQMIATKVSLFL